jgi:hypothetical protein
MLSRCRAVAKDGHGYILVLEDDDLRTLVDEARVIFPQTHEFPTLRDKFKKLVF